MKKILKKISDKTIIIKRLILNGNTFDKFMMLSLLNIRIAIIKDVKNGK
tara:strand:+ start:2316 stop:2462 length:147 start_codon:yes stop_codon:yes gene_type:complete